MDILSEEERRRRMQSVRSKGNRSTEWKFRSALMRRGISGWKLHVRSIPGVPDFFFPESNLVVFIDGCFWHGCPKCRRPLPQTNQTYWANKLKSNMTRARRISRDLRSEGFTVVRIWEHELRSQRSLEKLLRRLFMAKSR
jgi:DNA mismatch endonuclease (patch repair protein)